jgi:hypothetical protein
MRPVLFYTTMVLLLVSKTASGAEHRHQIDQPSHCAENERVIFTCEVGHKMVSVCASAVLSQDQGYLQYRFGRKGKKPEIEIPKKTRFKPAMVGYNSITSNSGFASYLRFSNGTYRYYVFLGTEPGSTTWKNGKWISQYRDNASGINMYKGNRSVYYKRCNVPADPRNFGEPLRMNAVTQLREDEDPYPHDVTFGN